MHWAIIYSIIHEKFQIFQTVKKTSHTAQFFSFFFSYEKLADYIFKCFSVYRPHVLVATSCDWMAYLFFFIGYFIPSFSPCVFMCIPVPLNAYWVGNTVQFSSAARSCPTLCHRMPGLPVHHQLPEFTQTHVQPKKKKKCDTKQLFK